MAVPGRVPGLWHRPEREARALWNVGADREAKGCREEHFEAWKLPRVSSNRDARFQGAAPAEVARRVPPAVLAGIILMSRENRGTRVQSVYCGHKVVTLIGRLELHCQGESHFKTDFI